MIGGRLHVIFRGREQISHRDTENTENGLEKKAAKTHKECAKKKC